VGNDTLHLDDAPVPILVPRNDKPKTGRLRNVKPGIANRRE
jgi:hypothetical protein